jgi:hypothetical protein
MMRLRSLAWIALCAAVLFSPPVGAEPAADRLTARKLAGEAMDLFEAGDYATALEKFTEADRLVPAPTLKLRIARSLDKLDRMLEAAEMYRTVIASELKPGAPAPHHQARKDAIPELAALLEQIPRVTVTVKGEGAADAQVFLAGAELPAAMIGERQEMDPGDYVFEARAGSREVREEMRLERGQTARVMLELPVPASEAPPPPPPSIVDDTPWVVGGWAAIALGGASLVVGAATGGVVLSEEDDLLARCPKRSCPPTDHDDARSFNALRATSTAMFVVGGVLTATGVTVLVLAPAPNGDPSESAIGARPVVGLAMLGLEGWFR